MNEVKTFLNSGLIKRVSIYFTFIFVFINIGMLLFNNSYEKYSTLQKESSFVRIVEHMIMDNGEETVYEYIEHFSHIHNTSIEYYFDGLLLYETEMIGSDFEVYDIIVEGNVVGEVLIDSSQSFNKILSSTLLLVINLFIVTVYIVSIILFYIYTSRGISKLLNDLNKLRLQIISMEFDDEEFYFTDFYDIYTGASNLNSKLSELEVSKSSELHAVTHDMKTPLTILLSYLEAVESG